MGAELTAGKTFGTVESVKAVSDLYAPASGSVTEVNGDLATSPEKVNKDAHGSWMVKITLKNPGELDRCSRAADYEKYVAEEGGTLKAVRTSDLRPNRTAFAALQAARSDESCTRVKRTLHASIELTSSHI